MYRFYDNINDDLLYEITRVEEQRYNEIKLKFEKECKDILSKYGWNYRISMDHWIDKTNVLMFKRYDGYTATLEIDIIDQQNNIVEYDESICSFFENITYISFDWFKKKYRVYQNEDFIDLWKEIKRFADLINVD